MMAAPLTSVGQLRRAIDIYLRVAYTTGQLPEVVKLRLLPWAGLPEDALVEPAWFEACVQEGRQQLALRLGHPGYPHMKLVLEESPDVSGYLFRADAHDRHLFAPPGSPDAAGLEQVRRVNAQIIEQIEREWMAAGLPTFRAYLRKQVEARRRQAGLINPPSAAGGT